MIHRVLQGINRILAKDKLHIFIYHQVLEKPDPLRPSEPTVEQFDWQMALISRYFTPLSLSEGVERLKAGELPPNAVCVTFDDGYLNNLTLAQPILAKYRVPATVYVATAFSGGENMWNDRVLHLFSAQNTQPINLQEQQAPLTFEDDDKRRETAYKLLIKLKYLEPEPRLHKVDELYSLNPHIKPQTNLMMSPQQVKELSDLGVEIGAHTHNHPILKVLDAQQQRQEIAESRDRLNQWTGREIKHFAYPNGVWQQDLDDNTVSIVKKMGFDSAVITNWGVANKHTSEFMLPRFTPWDKRDVKFHLRMLKNVFA